MAFNFHFSIMTNTVNSMTAAFGKQIENLSKQSSFDQYEFSGNFMKLNSSTKIKPKNCKPKKT